MFFFYFAFSLILCACVSPCFCFYCSICQMFAHSRYENRIWCAICCVYNEIYGKIGKRIYRSCKFKWKKSIDVKQNVGAMYAYIASMLMLTNWVYSPSLIFEQAHLFDIYVIISFVVTQYVRIVAYFFLSNFISDDQNRSIFTVVLIAISFLCIYTQKSRKLSYRLSVFCNSYFFF